MEKLFYFVLFLFLMIFAIDTVHAEKVLSSHPIIAIRIYNEQGNLVGTCRRVNRMFELYNLKEKKVNNPAEFLNQPENDCYLYNVEGYAIGKCTASRVILFKY